MGHYTFVKTHRTPTMNPDVKSELWVIMMSQCRKDCNKWTTEEECAHAWAEEGLRELCAFRSVLL